MFNWQSASIIHNEAVCCRDMARGGVGSIIVINANTNPNIINERQLSRLLTLAVKFNVLSMNILDVL